MGTMIYNDLWVLFHLELSMSEKKDSMMHGEMGEFEFSGDTAEFHVKIHTKLPAEHGFYTLVGRVASEWSHLEHILDLTIWDLLRIPPNFGACITSQIMGVGPRCKAISTFGVAHGFDDGLLKPFRKLSQDLFSVADWRARFVHDAWYTEVGSDKPSQFRAMPYVDPRYGIHEITRGEIDETINRIQELQERAHKMRNDVLDALAALQAKRS